MTYPPFDPVLQQWLHDHFGVKRLEMVDYNQLTGLTLMVQRGSESPAQFPDDVISAWHRVLGEQRRIVDQSEFALIEQLRRQDAPWRQVADVLGLESADAAQQCHAQLAETLRHPT